MTANEDFLFAQEAIAQGFVTEQQVTEAFRLQARMADELRLDERVGVILVKRGYLAEDQARRVTARIEPKGGEASEIEGYRLIDVVGRGAMGTVYRALHLGLQREVALKILRQDLAGDRTQIERLKAEAAMLASLDHPNVVRALDAGESNGFPYVAMEFVEGETLRERLRREGPLAEDEALRITRGIADALERARRKGVVHRDVKPGNILLAKDGTPKLMDLGLAKGPIDLGLTQHGATVGTPQFIAPEQAIDPRKADARSDVYGLGATLYAMLTGRPPFDGQTLAEILTKVLYEVPVPVRTLRPQVSPETGYLVERMMLRDPSLRYRTPALVVEDVDRLLGGASILPTGFTGNWEAYLLRKRTRRWLVSTGVAVAVAALAAGVYAFVSQAVRAANERTSVSARVERELKENVNPLSSKQDLEDRLDRVRRLEGEARGLDAPRLDELRGRRADLERETSQLDRLERRVVPPAVDDEGKGDYAAAARRYAEFLQSVPVYGVATEQARQRLEALQRRADDAIGGARRARFAGRPASLEAARGAYEEWDRALRRWPDTALARGERERAAAAAAAVASLAQEVRERTATVSRAAVATRIGARELSDLSRDLAAASRQVEAELVRREAAVRAADGFAWSDVEALARSAVAGAGAAAAADVAAAVRGAIDDARRVAAEGDAEAALRSLEGWRDAALKDGAWPVAAADLAAEHQRLARATEDERAEARRVLARLLDGLVVRLRARDMPGFAADLREVRERGGVVRTVAAALDALDAVPDLWDSIDRRALDGLARHVGPDPKSWLGTVELSDGSVARQWEIQSVDAAARELVVVSHSGGGVPGKPTTRRLADLSEDERARLAGLGDEPDDLARRALRELAAYDRTEPAFYERIARLRESVRLLEGAGRGSHPLAEWARDRLALVQAEADEAERSASNNFESARANEEVRRYSEAYYHYGVLRQSSLRLTRFVSAHEAEVVAAMRRIEGFSAESRLSLHFKGGRVTLRQGTPPDAPEFEVRFSFDTPEQLRNFTAGLARLVPAPPGRIVTPQPDPTDQSLVLLPDDEGVVVRDAPLVLPSPFDPSAERWISFDLWVKEPLFLGIDLDGVQAGILSAEPVPFPPGVPLLEGEKERPRLNPFGRGRGVMFRADPARATALDFGDPATWGWEDGHQARHFVQPKDLALPKRRDQLGKHWFAFTRSERPYSVRFHVVPGAPNTTDPGHATLTVDDKEVWTETSEKFRSPPASRTAGRIQILTFTTCVIDNLVVSGRISKELKAALNESPAAAPTPPPPTGAPGKSPPR